MSQVLAKQNSILIDEWDGCYRGGWKGVIVDAAFAHPAKVAFNLAKRIYEHAIDEGWIQPKDVVIDPFGGIGGCAFHGLMNGMIAVTNELEEKFVNLSKENRELWRKQYTGLPGFDANNWIILQGDSRKLASVIEAQIAVSSPPYSTLGQNQGTDNRRHEVFASEKQAHSANAWREGYGQSEGQLGSMREGDLSLAISSPPYAVVSPEKSSRSVDYAKQYETYRLQGGGASFEKFVATQELHSQGYGSADGQLSTLKDSGFAAAVSSPPYNPPMSQDHNGSRGGKRGTEPSETGAFVKYGNSEGQIEGLSMEGFQAAISSPPYEASTQVNNTPGDMTEGRARWEGGTDSAARVKQDYADYGKDNLGNERGDTFWSASRTILEQLYSILTPGAHAIFIVKAFVRNKQIVDFPDQWAQLCEAVGFKLIHDHHAMLTEHSGTQGGMFGADKEYKVKRVSFFRRLHEKRAPETEIHYENVLCFERR